MKIGKSIYTKNRIDPEFYFSDSLNRIVYTSALKRLGVPAG
jgi:hypothetical protein